ncbi:MAG: HAD-IA family hydrolase [Oscillospiraceae bacterium]|nr:HAD-IA family hydrolase [Oscillospiraceae bacterium]
MIKVVFFDIDNTLLSFSGYVKEAMKVGFAQFGLKEYTEDMYSVFERINNSLWTQIEQGALSYNELLKIRWNMIFKELNISFDGEVFEKHFKERLFSSAVPEPHAMEILEYLSKGYVLCAASNGPYEQQLNRLKVGKMQDYFTRIFISSKIGAAKPRKQFFDYCFKDLRESLFPDLSPDETIIIGDSVSSDIAGGKAYGLKTCLYQPQPAEGPENCCADYVVSDLSDIKLIL